MIRMLLPVWCLLIATGARAASEAELIAGVFDPPREAPELGLEGTKGKQLRLRDYRGKVVILGFGFTSCTSVCPVTLAVLAQTRKRLGVLAEQVQVVYVTVDPEADTVERMRTYLEAFDPSFVGGTGSEEALQAVRKEYGILASRERGGSGYTYAHSSYVFLIDREGRLRALMPFGHTPDDFAHDLRVLLAAD
jgi:protein SCO1/2